jgi:hypothetical protein
MKAVMTLCDGTVIDAPSRAKVSRALETLSKKNWYAILDRGDEVYMQVGVGGGEGTGTHVPVGAYNLEHRAGDVDAHYRHETTDLKTVIQAFQEFASGDDDWVKRLTWERVHFKVEVAFWSETRVYSKAEAEVRYQQILADENPVPLRKLDKGLRAFVREARKRAPEAEIVEIGRYGDEPLYSRLGIAVNIPSKLVKKIYPEVVGAADDPQLHTYDRTDGYVMGMETDPNIVISDAPKKKKAKKRPKKKKAKTR